MDVENSTSTEKKVLRIAFCVHNQEAPHLYKTRKRRAKKLDAVGIEPTTFHSQDIDAMRNENHCEMLGKARRLCGHCDNLLPLDLMEC
jgi:hypothetical protein